MSHGIPPEKLAELKEKFDQFDVDKNGSINVRELANVFQALGESVPGYKLREMIAQADLDENGTVEFNEFLKAIMEKREWRVLVSKSPPSGAQASGARSNAATSQHTSSSAEQRSFADWINRLLKDDTDLKTVLPLSEGGDDLCSKCKNGILLCKMVNKSVADTIDERAINKGELNASQTTENLNLAINSALSIGCTVVNIGWKDIADEKKPLILGLLWQLIRIDLLGHVNAARAKMAVLVREGENQQDLAKLSAEELLLRWVNYQLGKAGLMLRISSFQGDIKNSEAYAHLLNQIAPKNIPDLMKPEVILQNPDMSKRAHMVVANAEKMGAAGFVSPRDIIGGDGKLNLAFVANLFKHFPAMEVSKKDEKPVEETREENTYRNWMNSLGVNPYVCDLCYDLNNGLLLFQIYDCIRKGHVNWDKINKPPFKMGGNLKKIENCNYAVELGKGFNFSLDGISGEGIVKGTRSLVLPFVWQMMRAYTLSNLAKVSGGDGSKMTDAEIVDMVNQKLTNAGKTSRISNFKDPSITDSRVVLDLIDSIRPGLIKGDLIETGETEKAKLANAKLAISCARKAGAQVYALPQDLVEVNDKMTLTVFACLMTLGLQK